jgi:AcrR family transcriptional regulator
MGRPREFDRHKAVESAMLIFWREGYPGASVEQLCEAMGVGSSSFYAAFASKEELFREAVACYLDSLSRHVWGRLTEGNSARKNIEAALLAAAAHLPATPETPGGCMIGLGATCGSWPATATEAVRNGRHHWTNLIRAPLRTAPSARGSKRPACAEWRQRDGAASASAARHDRRRLSPNLRGHRAPERW